MPKDAIALKDPSIVRHRDRWHLFFTMRGRTRSHAVAWCACENLDDLPSCRAEVLGNHAAYCCAPQIFFFRPHGVWYLIAQAKDGQWDPEYQAVFATTKDIDDPASWTALTPLGLERPAGEHPAYLDFWAIADGDHTYVFLTTDDGHIWRSRTEIDDFPHGWSPPTLAYCGDVFEANHVYKLADRSGYLNLVEAQRPDDRRYYKALHAERLDGEWTEVRPAHGGHYAEPDHVQQLAGRWTDSVSHGELLRVGHDERLEARADAPLLFQGVLHADRSGKPYGEIPWGIGLLTPATAD